MSEGYVHLILDSVIIVWDLLMLWGYGFWLDTVLIYSCKAQDTESANSYSIPVGVEVNRVFIILVGHRLIFFLPRRINSSNCYCNSKSAIRVRKVSISDILSLIVQN